MNARDYVSESADIDREDIRHEERQRRLRDNWRCPNKCVTGTCPECDEHFRELEEE